jgi:hypothetical protein
MARRLQGGESSEMARLWFTLALVLGCVRPATPEPAEPPVRRAPAATPDGAEGGEEGEMVAALEALATKEHDRDAKPALGEPTKTATMCNRGRCPTGYRCGAAPGRPRKVCHATSQHRAGPRDVFKP